MSQPFANYEEERRLFRDLVDLDSSQRVLLFHGESGSGKTALLRHCLNEDKPPSLPAAQIQLRNTSTAVADAFYQLGRRVGWERLHAFKENLEVLARVESGELNTGLPAAITAHLNLALHAENHKERFRRRSVLTEALIEDCCRLPDLIMLIVDTYERASEGFRSWIELNFLTMAMSTKQVRVVIAGQHVPDYERQEWSDCCTSRQLQGVTDEHSWLDVAETMGKHVPSLEWLDGACAIVNGNPAQIQQFLETLEDAPGPTPKTARRPMRVLLRRNLVEYFDESGLQVLAFDLNVDYEQLTGRNKDEHVISLIRYLESRGRLDELWRAARDQRPHLQW